MTEFLRTSLPPVPRMIISASYKTDIPAFYGKWFMNRLDAGYCLMFNPFNRAQVYRISLAPEDVDGFVFWTKNIGPFLPSLERVHRRGYPFLINYSLNNYPRTLESSVADAGRSVEHMKRIAGQYGPRRVVWRYDPILFTSLTSADFHRRNFAGLARSLTGVTDEAIVSFATIYKKTQRNLDGAAGQCGFTWTNPGDEQKQALLRDLVGIAAAEGMRIRLCSQPNLLVPGIEPSRCIHAARLSEISGRPIRVRPNPSRPGCLCHDSKDIGEYDTCPHGCIYCYAVSYRELARRRHQAHDPQSEFLFTRSLAELAQPNAPAASPDDQNLTQPDLFA